MTLQVQLLLPEASVPTKSTPGAAGWDLYAAEHRVIGPCNHGVVETGIAVSMPVDCVGLIWPRSGLAVRHGVDVLAGVIDSDYRGGVGVVLANHGADDFVVDVGDRIAQLLVQKVEASQLRVVEKLGRTHRGGLGFGSTGK